MGTFITILTPIFIRHLLLGNKLHHTLPFGYEGTLILVGPGEPGRGERGKPGSGNDQTHTHTVVFDVLVATISHTLAVLTMTTAHQSAGAKFFFL